MMNLEDRCYVDYGKGFKPLKIKSFVNKNKLIKMLKLKGLNCNSANGKKCKTTPTFLLVHITHNS